MFSNVSKHLNVTQICSTYRHQSYDYVHVIDDNVNDNTLEDGNNSNIKTSRTVLTKTIKLK